MSGFLVVFFALFMILTILPLLLIVLIAVPRRRKLVTINAHDFPELVRLRNVTTTSRVIGFVVGLVIIVMIATVGRFGLGILLTPAVFAGALILATVVAGMITRDSARTPGTAGLEVRRARTYLPTFLTTLIAAVTGVLVLAMAWTTAVAVPDDMGFAGRAFNYVYPCEYTECSSGFSPWPGSYYTLPLAIVLATVVLLAVIAVVVTVRRPRNSSDSEIVRVDDAVRSRAVESVVAALGIASAGSLFAVGALVGMGLGINAELAPTALRVAGWSGWALAALALAVSVWCVVVLLMPGTTGPRAQASHAPAATTPETL